MGVSLGFSKSVAIGNLLLHIHEAAVVAGIATAAIRETHSQMVVPLCVTPRSGLLPGGFGGNRKAESRHVAVVLV